MLSVQVTFQCNGHCYFGLELLETHRDFRPLRTLNSFISCPLMLCTAKDPVIPGSPSTIRIFGLRWGTFFGRLLTAHTQSPLTSVPIRRILFLQPHSRIPVSDLFAFFESVSKLFFVQVLTRVFSIQNIPIFFRPRIKILSDGDENKEMQRIKMIVC